MLVSSVPDCTASASSFRPRAAQVPGVSRTALFRSRRSDEARARRLPQVRLVRSCREQSSWAWIGRASCGSPRQAAPGLRGRGTHGRGHRLGLLSPHPTRAGHGPSPEAAPTRKTPLLHVNVYAARSQAPAEEPASSLWLAPGRTRSSRTGFSGRTGSESPFASFAADVFIYSNASESCRAAWTTERGKSILSSLGASLPFNYIPSGLSLHNLSSVISSVIPSFRSLLRNIEVLEKKAYGIIILSKCLSCVSVLQMEVQMCRTCMLGQNEKYN